MGVGKRKMPISTESSFGQFVQSGLGMRRGLNGAGDGLLLITNKQKNNKNYPVGENRTADKARQGKAGTRNIRRRTGTRL